MNKLKKLFFITSFIFILASFFQYAHANSVVRRVSGSNRYGTAIEISKYGWPKGSDNIIIATGENFSDALCSGPLSKIVNAPILLTETKSLDSKLINEIKRTKAKKVYIIGRENVVSRNVENQLKSIGITSITRLGGNDRYETSLIIAREIQKSTGIINNIAVAVGTNFPDALSISPISAQLKMPILLSNEKSLPSSIDKFIAGSNVTNSFIIGSTNVISTEIQNRLKSITKSVERLAGQNRYETNTAVISRFKNNLNFNFTYLATGANFPDALSGSALAPQTNSPILLVSQNNTAEAKKLIQSYNNNIMQFNALGGDCVISNNTLNLLGLTKNTTGNTQNNIINGGLAATQGEWVYFANFSDGGKLYKMKSDGSSKTKLHDFRPDYMNVIGDWIYFSSGNNIFRIKIDGNKFTQLFKSPDYTPNKSINYMYAINDTIYYKYDDGTFYKMNLDGTNIVKLPSFTDSVSNSFYIDNDTVYYLKSSVIMDNLYKSKLNGSDTKLLVNETIYGFVKSGNYIYYVAKVADPAVYGIFKYNLLNGEKKLITKDVRYPCYSEGINLQGEWIYYVSSIDERLYKIKTDGSTKTKLTINTLYIEPCINIAGENIFYRRSIYDYKLQKLEKANHNGAYAKTLVKDKIELMKMSNGWVYYINGSDNNRIYKVKSDGTYRTKLTQYPASDFDIYGDFIYYANSADGKKLYKININGSSNIKICNLPGEKIRYYKNSLFFININDNQTLYKLPLTGLTPIKLGQEAVSAFDIGGDLIYYHGYYGPTYFPSAIFKMDLNGGNKIKLYEDNEYNSNNLSVKNLRIYNSWVYFDNDAKACMLSKIKIDGSFLTALYKPAGYFSLDNNLIYSIETGVIPFEPGYPDYSEGQLNNVFVHDLTGKLVTFYENTDLYEIRSFLTDTNYIYYHSFYNSYKTNYIRMDGKVDISL